MNRLFFFLVVCFFIVLGVPAECFSNGPQKKQADVTSKSVLIDIPPELAEKFENPDKAPLELGDASDRVREVQASLNEILRGKTIKLAQPIYVGPEKAAEYSGNNNNNQRELDAVRLGYSKRYGKAFVIPGSWEPFYKINVPIVEPPEGSVSETNFLRFGKIVLTVDGVYGQHTRAAVAMFQLSQNLPATGKVDVVTLDKLEPMIPTNPILAVVMQWLKNRTIGPIDFSVAPFWTKTGTAVIVTLFILVASAVVYHFARMFASSTRILARWLFTPSSSPWFTAQQENKVFLNAAQFAPALFIYVAALSIFPAPDESHDEQPYLNVFQNWHDYISQLGLAYVSLVLMLVAFAVVRTFDSVYNPDQQTENPIGGMIRAAKRIIALIGTLLICASLLGKSPFYIVGGLGAFMAVILLVFRDYLLGLVASVQIIANKVVKIGDWITMPKYNADGDVQEISLTLIKVQNFDKTISTIPTNSILDESFRNWTGMQTAGGRRIKRAILIDMHTIQVCTPEMIERFEKIELIRDYLEQKRSELEEFNRQRDIDASIVNSRRLTNVGTFRAYLEAYLGSHPGLSGEMTFLVRHLSPTNNGLPIEIYAFCKETAWSEYEAIQADIFDHVIAILPEFGLQAFQEVTNNDPDIPANSWSPQLQVALAEIDNFIEVKNNELSENAKAGLAPRVEKVKRKIAQLGLADYVDADGSGRTITLRHLQSR